MPPPPEAPQTRAAGVPLQRVDQVSSAVPESWLAEAEHQQEADRVDRLAADFEMVTDLALEGFNGQNFDVFQSELARYALAVLMAWMRRGLILARCRDRGFGGLPEPPLRAFDDPDTVESLAGLTVAVALEKFRTTVLMRGRWDYRRGASLRTYFIGQCLIRFANIYRDWHTDHMKDRQLPSADHETLEALERRQVPGVAELVLEQEEITRALSGMQDPRVRTAFIRHAQGYTQDQIAAELGVNRKAVERMLANERDRLKLRRGIG